MKERIQKILAAAGVASRRAIEEMIRDGRIAVNGKVTTSLPILVDPDKDKVAIDGEGVRIKGHDVSKKYYVLMYKPKGVYSTNVSQGAQTRAIDLLPEDFPARVYPVGQLDAEAKGLLLLTNDGPLSHRLAHPRYGVEKVYEAEVEGDPDEETLARLSEGVDLDDGRTAPARARRHRRSRVELVLHEGRITAEIAHHDATEERVMVAATGNLAGTDPAPAAATSPEATDG